MASDETEKKIELLKNVFSSRGQVHSKLTDLNKPKEYITHVLFRVVSFSPKHDFGEGRLEGYDQLIPIKGVDFRGIDPKLITPGYELFVDAAILNSGNIALLKICDTDENTKIDYANVVQTLGLPNISKSATVLKSGMNLIKDIGGLLDQALQATPALDVELLRLNVQIAFKAAQVGISLVEVEDQGLAPDDAVADPVPDLTANQITEIQEYGETNPWSGGRGTAAIWLKENYGKWIPGLLREHLLPDFPLYRAVSRLAREKKLPFDVPTADENALRKLSSAERVKLKAAREITTQRVKSWRARNL